MATRSLNRVQLIGNLTRDPELRYTPQGTAVCTFGLATNRSWVTGAGEKREEPEFHRIVAWNKLAEICAQFLTKGRKVYVEGRISTRSWTDQAGAQHQVTEIIISDMIILDGKGAAADTAIEVPENLGAENDMTEALPPELTENKAVASKDDNKKSKKETADDKNVKEDQEDQKEEMPF